MKWTKKLGAAAGASALLALGTVAPANAYTFQTQVPETPENTESLPIVSTYHKSDHLKANILNARPVCNTWEDYRTVVYQTDESFTPVGTISTKNQTQKDIPLTQDLSKTQTVSLSVNGSRTESLNVNLGGTGNLSKGSIDAGLAYSLAKTVGGDASYSLSWSAGQTIGPYDVPAGYTGEATYGFKMVNLTGTQQYCQLNGTWSNPVAWRANVPIKNEVQVKLYDKNSDSYITSYDEDGEVISYG
ncbi:hypothetical protein [Rothia aerolata]|uniref:Peptidase n=1 Tax=Rothia aerolata TaxID=1812262 RepID=A0A917IVD4_9MICC|nr:hypothetical protein [Rothia aerolata]GGH65041.1 hypothetical protein GCM10007359_17890 [Rothia aerolata]